MKFEYPVIVSVKHNIITPRSVGMKGLLIEALIALLNITGLRSMEPQQIVNI